MGIGSALKELLEEKGTNPNALGEKIGVSPATIYSMIRRDSSKVEFDVLVAIANELGVDLDYFYNLKQKELASIHAKENEELQEYLSELKDRPEMRMLFKVTKKASKEDVEKTVKMLEAWGYKDDGDNTDY